MTLPFLNWTLVPVPKVAIKTITRCCLQSQRRQNLKSANKQVKQLCRQTKQTESKKESSCKIGPDQSKNNLKIKFKNVNLLGRSQMLNKLQNCCAPNNLESVCALVVFKSNTRTCIVLEQQTTARRTFRIIVCL